MRLVNQRLGANHHIKKNSKSNPFTCCNKKSATARQGYSLEPVPLDIRHILSLQGTVAIGQGCIADYIPIRTLQQQQLIIGKAV